jgi:hypothetical protein
MIQLRIYRGRADRLDADTTLAALFRDRSLHVQSTRTAHDSTELSIDVEGSVEGAVVRLIDVLAQAVRTKRIADFHLSLADGTTIACPKGRAIQVSWPSLLGKAPAALGAVELASYLAEQLGAGAARLR